VADSGLLDKLAAVRAVLFDFDGPICGVFAGLSPHSVAAELVTMLKARGVPLTASQSAEQDPLDILEFSPSFGPDVTKVAEDALCAAEVRAVAIAEPTPGGLEAVRACVESGKIAAIVSNNSADAVHAYLKAHGIDAYVSLVVGRAYVRPDLMKPNPYPLVKALGELDLTAGEVVFIGDSTADVDAAKAAGVVCVGFANKPEKMVTLAGADVLIEDMRLFADALSAIE
jgi:phosphoglycolate phosphatase-like HAD superfamily hydrolase